MINSDANFVIVLILIILKNRCGRDTFTNCYILLNFDFFYNSLSDSPTLFNSALEVRFLNNIIHGNDISDIMIAVRKMRL